MALFSRNKLRAKPVPAEPEDQPLDPVALCLAVWLGAMVSVLGVVRLLDGAAQAANMVHGPAALPSPACPMAFAS